MQSFTVLCDTNWPAGEGNGNPDVRDIMSLYLPSLQDCMAACAEFNVGHKAGGGANDGYCRSVAILKSGKSEVVLTSEGRCPVDSDNDCLQRAEVVI